MTDPRFIPPSDREYDRQHVLAGARPTVADYLDLSDHATFMDERDARQRDLIQRLADRLNCPYIRKGTMPGECDCAACELVAEARGIEAPNE